MKALYVMPRGINVGTHHRVSMPRLRELLQEAGLGSTHTILQSGNIIVWPPEPTDPLQVADTVSELMVTHFQVQVPCLVRTHAELRAILDLNPLDHLADDGAKYLVTFLSATPPAEAVTRVLDSNASPEVLYVAGREVFIWAPHGVKALKHTHADLARRFGGTATTRNWNTLQKVLDAMQLP